MPVLGVIFIGPSLRSGRPEVRDLEYRPPAGRGDIIAAAQEGVKVIGLVDGRFYESLSVSPTEMSEAAATGARLYGAASMGALRACDCPGIVQGLGVVYERFLSGELQSDDEVAVSYNPQTYETHAWPLVNVREALKLASGRGLLDEKEEKLIIRHVKELPFASRTEKAIGVVADEVLGLRRAERILAILHSDEVNVKAADALLLIKTVTRELERLRFQDNAG